MIIKNIVIGGLALVSSLAFGVSGASANMFIESDTKADLVGGGDDSVITVVRVGKQDGALTYGIGAGYNSVGDEAVINGLFEYNTRITRKTVIGASVEATYGLDSDNLIVEPQLRLRRYF